METFYDHLRLTRHASFEDIRIVINQRRAALQTVFALGERKTQLEQLNAAERVLLNPELRARYDQEHFPGAKISYPVPAAAQPPALPEMPPLPGTTSSVAAPAAPPHLPAAAVAAPATCDTCGTRIAPGARHCPVCGTEFAQPPPLSVSSPSAVPSFANIINAIPAQTPDQLKEFFKWIGWSHARGTIVSSDPPYLVDQEFILSKFLLKVGLIALGLWLLYHWLLREMGFLIILLFGVILLFVFIGGAAALLLGSLFKVVTFFIPGASKEKKQVQVRDVRLRDEQMHEYIVRFRGELRSGHISVGDQIEIWGKDRGGTIMGRWGYNFRTRSRIWVKYQ